MSTISLGQEQSGARAESVSRAALWTGRVLSAIPALFLLLDAVGKLVKPTPEPVVQAMNKLGYAPDLAPVLGIILLVCTVVYIIPRTAVLGAILLTGYLGGAVVSHLRVGDPLSFQLFPVIVGAMLWGGLFLRDVCLRSLTLDK